MSEQQDGVVTFTGHILSIQTIRRGTKNFELTEVRMDIGRDKNSTILFEAKKDDPLIVADEYDKVTVKLWVNFREWNDKIFTSCTLKEMTVLERADRGVNPQEVAQTTEQAQEQTLENLPF